jgi:hypothetical protein
MIKRFLAWLTRIERSKRPPLLQGQEHAQPKAPPPPPPPRAQVPASEQAHEEVPRPPRGLRLIKGDRTEDVAMGSDAGPEQAHDETSIDPAEADREATATQEATGTDHPSVKLVFSDGSTSRLTASGPTGVRIRYLAENILPPEGS